MAATRQSPLHSQRSSSWPEARAAVLGAVNIVDLIGRHVRLTRRGRDFFGLCPFHQEKTPSFKVSPDRQYFYCFGCKASGNALDFVMRRDRIEFREALRLLAEQTNIALPSAGADRVDSGQRQLLFDAHAAACQVFQRLLHDDHAGAAARKYLADRGFTDKSIADFRIGLAADSWDTLRDNPAMGKFSPPLLTTAGLLRPSPRGDGVYDTFRNRLIFPIRDESGRVIAFGGRVMPGSDDPAKYLNSPETPLFSKGRSLFGLDLARSAIVESRCVAVVEGYTDVVMAHQFGIGNVVSVLGTALTPAHVATLRRFADRIVLLFDPDAAGNNAVERALELFLTQPIEIAIAGIPGGLDPDELLLRDGADGFNKVLGGSIDALEFLWKRLQGEFRGGDDLTNTQRVVDRYLEMLGSAQKSGAVDELRWAGALARVARLTGMPLETLHRRFGKTLRRQAIQSTRPTGSASPPTPDAAPDAGQLSPAQIRAEREILGLAMLDDACWLEVRTQLKPADFADSDCRNLAEFYWRQRRDLPDLQFNQVLGALTDPGVDERSPNKARFDPAAASANDRPAESRPGAAKSLAELAVELVESAQAVLDAVNPPDGPKDNLPVPQGLTRAIEYLAWTRSARRRDQATASLKTAPSTDSDEVEILRQLEASAKAASERFKNL